MDTHAHGDAWFVYDGECPLCRSAATALRIRKAVGQLHLVDARHDLSHPVLAEVNRAGLDLDQGMVIKFGGRLYHGAEALTLMALIGTGRGWFNRMNAMLFVSPRRAAFAYPALRGLRNLLIRALGKGRINNLDGR